MSVHLEVVCDEVTSVRAALDTVATVVTLELELEDLETLIDTAIRKLREARELSLLQLEMA